MTYYISLFRKTKYKYVTFHFTKITVSESNFCLIWKELPILNAYTKSVASIFYCCSVTKSCLTLSDPTAHQASLSFTVFWSLLKFMSIESVILSNHLILCHPLLLLPSIFPSIRVFSNESALCIKQPKYPSFK